MSSTYPAGDRVHRGQVHWCEVPECAKDLAALKNEDRFAWNGFITLIEDAKQGGVEIDDTLVRSPLPFAPHGAFEPPWLGEFKVVGKPTKHWRLYFGEPINYQDHVVRVRLWYKVTTWTKAATDQREHDAIKKAMEILKWFFKKEGYEWSQFPN